MRKCQTNIPDHLQLYSDGSCQYELTVCDKFDL